MKYRIKRLDLNVAYACNLACKGCISLSDFDRRGVEPLQDLKVQCETWSKLLDPSIISIFGGEPLLHPKLHSVLDIIRKCWPMAQIRLITNGYLLKRYDPESWFKFGQLEMQVSIHRQDHEKLITNYIKEIVKRRSNWKTTRNIVEGHKQLELHNENLTIYKSKFKKFVMPYKKVNGELRPFKSNPKKAHSICGNPDVPILYKNKLYKCAPIANLKELDKKGLYKYEGIGPNGDLEPLISNINKPESVCAMCPEDPGHSIDHFKKENVDVKAI